jgi:hypothetical protein
MDRGKHSTEASTAQHSDRGDRLEMGRTRKTTTTSVAQYPRQVDGLAVNAVEDGFMIYQPEADRVHYLNHTAVVILELCNGRNTPARIATLLKHAYGLSGTPEREVTETLVKMRDEGLIRRTAPGRKRQRISPGNRRRS